MSDQIPGAFSAPPTEGTFGTGPLPKRRNIFAVWLGLPIITLGVYSLVWYYKINRETGFGAKTKPSPGLSLLAVTFGALLVIPAWVSVYKTGERIAASQRAAGITITCNGWIGLLLAFFAGLYPLYYQMEMNKLIDTYPGAATDQQVPLRAPAA